MKTLITLLYLTIASIAYSQENHHPDIKFQRSLNKLNSYVEKLGITDKNAIIIRCVVTNPWILGNASESYLVILSDGRMFKYAGKDVAASENFDFEWQIKNEEITDEAEKKKFVTLVEKTNEIKQEKLNLTQKTISVEGDITTEESFWVSDANTYILEIYKNELNSRFDSYAPEQYIERQYNGYEMRQKFLDIVNGFYFEEELFGK